jgi:hypothetical protein
MSRSFSQASSSLTNDTSHKGRQHKYLRRFVASLPQHENIRDNDITLKKLVGRGSRGMVEIIQDSVVPNTRSVVPSISLTIKQTIYNDALLRLDGVVLSEDDKYLSTLVPLAINPPQSSIGVRYLGDYSMQNQMTYTIDLMFVLDRKALDYVEEVRQKNKKRDVVLKFVFNWSTLSHNLKVGRYNKTRLQPGGPEVLVVNPGPGSPNDENLNLRILVSEHENLFINQSSTATLGYTIRASDWVNDFQGPLGIGKFLIVEIPQPELGGAPTANLGVEQKEFLGRLNKANDVLLSMEQELNKGEWGSVVAKSRELLELFRKDMKGFIKEMIAVTTSMDVEKAASLTGSIDGLYGYASDLHHTVDNQGKVKEDIYTGGKEDAYMVYLISTSLVNLLRRKFIALTAKINPRA